MALTKVDYNMTKNITGGLYTVSSQITLTAAAAIVFSGTTARRIVKIQSTSGTGVIDMSALTPQIQVGVTDGQELLLLGLSDADVVVLKNGNGLKLNGEWMSTANSALELFWNATSSLWTETGRA